jgi:hypothetical protein
MLAVDNLKYVILLLVSALLIGCVEHKDYFYRDFQVSREGAYDAVMHVLATEGYEVTRLDENWVRGLPEIYLETDWNMSQTGNPYPGNDVRRRASIKITTIYSERERFEYQPLTEDDAEELRRRDEEAAKRAELEHTRISVAIRAERRSNVRQPIRSDWIYEGSDNYEVGAILGRLEGIFGETRYGGSRPSAQGERLREQDLRSR